MVSMRPFLVGFGLVLAPLPAPAAPKATPKLAVVPEAFRFGPDATDGLSADFVRVRLPRGVAAEFPRKWRILGEDENKLIGLAAGTVVDLSGGAEVGEEQLLVASNSMPTSTYATVRITATRPPSLTPSGIAELNKLVGTSAADDPELRVLVEGMRQQLANLAKMGNPLREFYGMRVDRMSGFPVLVTEYRRAGQKGDVYVQLNNVMTPTQDIAINFSYRASEAAQWKPVIARMRGSVTIK